MEKYTVALMRPQRFIREMEDSFCRQCDLGYLAQVEAGSVDQAVVLARKEICKADRRDCRQDIRDRCLALVQPEEYDLLWVFAGHVSAIAYGFETH